MFSRQYSFAVEPADEYGPEAEVTSNSGSRRLKDDSSPITGVQMALFGNFAWLAYCPCTKSLLSEAAPFLRRGEAQLAVSQGSWLREGCKQFSLQPQAACDGSISFTTSVGERIPIP